jgi:hypothetical protein
MNSINIRKLDEPITNDQIKQGMLAARAAYFTFASKDSGEVVVISQGPCDLEDHNNIEMKCYHPGEIASICVAGYDELDQYTARVRSKARAQGVFVGAVIGALFYQVYDYLISLVL